MPFSLRITIVGALLMIVSALTWADQGNYSVAEQENPASTASQTQIRAFIDPETGRLVNQPVTEEQRRAVEQTEHGSRQIHVVEIRRGDGTVIHELNGAADSFLKATIDQDGVMQTECNDPTHKHNGNDAKPQTEVRDVR